ncbi:MAG: glucans biosynthesis glucosyltransferase MdoH [Pseudomonadota bacterium]
MSAQHPLMPPEAPMGLPEQRFDRPFRDAAAPGVSSGKTVFLWRLVVFAVTLSATGGLSAIMLGWFAGEGISLLEGSLVALICFNFFWISLTVVTVLAGLASLSRQPVQPPDQSPAESLDVALLVPIYNEDPALVMGNARAMMEALRRKRGRHSYTLFILSDTRDDTIAAAEEAAVLALRGQLKDGTEVFYRRRARNTRRKVGNIADWVENWGGGWPAMLVLDADSLMTARAISRLTDALARDPGAGLIQSFPQLIGAQSVFARSQQFANGVYGAALAEGLARWTGQEGNYWGHNAIIRTEAFARCAGLPDVRSIRGKRRIIMSHDFVEAGLLRRAGWGVRFLPRIRGSYEETPPTLIDHIARDRRWCQGNLQHLRLLGTRGMRAVSRFHLFHGAMGYILSPVWFVLLLIWAAIGNGEEASLLSYFSEDNPLFPTWPEMNEGRHVLVLLLMYAMLLMPKILGVIALPFAGTRVSDLGGPGRLAASFLAEVLLSIAYAPILMVQQLIAVFRTIFGLQSGWSAQVRTCGDHGFTRLLRAHWLETISGVTLVVGICAGLVTPWLLPIALSLALAIPLSGLSGRQPGRWAKGLLGTPEDYREPPIMGAARRYRAEFRAQLSAMSAPAE